MHSDFWKTLLRAMAYNLIWYIPLFITVVCYFSIPSASDAFHNVTNIFKGFGKHFWVLFFSPAAYLFFSTEIESILLPFQMMLLIPIYFERSEWRFRKKILLSTLTVIGLYIAMLLLQVIIWGSFPHINDVDGSRLRLIPFVPWPNQPLF